MKKAVFVVLFAFMFMNLCCISALDISLTKSSYYPGETLQAEIPAAFTENLNKEDVKIYLGNAAHETGVESGILKLDNEYLFYAILPDYQGNFTIRIEGKQHYEGSVQTTADVSKSFTIVSSNASYLAINPGNKYTSSNFSIIVRGYNAEKDYVAEFEATGEEKSFTLGYGNEKTLFFSIAGINNFTNSNIVIGNYRIPIIVSPLSSVQNWTNQTANNNSVNLSDENFSLEDLVEVFPEEIEATVLEGLDYYFRLELFLDTGETITNIEISSPEEYIEISPEEIDELENDETINITINADEDFEGIINITSDRGYIEIPVTIIVTQNETDVISNVPPLNEEKRCVDMGGIFCDSSKGESCTGIETPALDGICCRASCNVSNSGGGMWIWGLLILIVLGLGAWWFYNKQKQNPGQGKSAEVVKKRSAEYEKRLKPEPLKEVRGDLSRI